MTTLVPLEFACARVVSESAEGSTYICKTGAGRPVIPPESLTRFLETQLVDHEASAIANPFGEGTLHIVSWPLGVNARWGTLFAASAAEFLPTDVLLLRGASTQAVLSLDSARSRAREIDQLTLETEKLRAAAALAQLRAHLEPHFLLNTLNAIAGLVTANPSEARNLLVFLGDLLRGLLSDQAELQTLDKQIEWLSWYAQILKIRHAGRLLFRWEIAEQAKPVLLPRLLLQPLLENAVKHGALKRETGGEVIVRANVVNVNGVPRLLCTIEDNGPGLAEGEVREGAQGLLAVKRALALYYGDKASLRLESSPSGTKAIVELPAERSRR